MRNRGSLLLLAIIISTVLLTTGCDKFDRLRSVESKKNRYMKQGKQYLSEKKTREAMQRFTLATRVDPKWAEAQYQFGLAASQARDYGRAYKAFQNAMKLD